MCPPDGIGKASFERATTGRAPRHPALVAAKQVSPEHLGLRRFEIAFQERPHQMVISAHRGPPPRRATAPTGADPDERGPAPCPAARPERRPLPGPSTRPD